MKRLVVMMMVMAGAPNYIFAQTETGVRNVTVEEFQQGIDSLNDEIIIDLRTPEELKQGKIADARVIDFFGPDFEPAIAKLEKNKVYFLYCASGARSGETADLMKGMGFKMLFNLEGGFRQWVAKKMPVKKR
jgi:rhodanese-related sulfurtransferase